MHRFFLGCIMVHLLSVTLLWAFSFSLIGVFLAGQVDSWFSVLTRVALATLVFLPFLKPALISAAQKRLLMLIGAIQLGLMYGFYYHAFLFLSVPEVLLFTVMTPVYIALISDVFNGQVNFKVLSIALIATVGAIGIRFDGISGDFLLGFALTQGANVCFATGQVLYKRYFSHHSLPHSQIFGWFFIGALMVAFVSMLLFGNWQALPTTPVQWGVLFWLGLIASGIGYFAWNKGATLVNTGTLAAMNNLLIPAGIVVNVVIWNRDADLFRLGIGALIIIGSVCLAQRWVKTSRRPD